MLEPNFCQINLTRAEMKKANIELNLAIQDKYLINLVKFDHVSRSIFAKLILYFVKFSFTFVKLNLGFTIFISAYAELILRM